MEPARWRSGGSISTKTMWWPWALCPRNMSKSCASGREKEMGSEAEVGVGSDVTYRARSLGFSLKCYGKCFSVLGWYDLIHIFESNRWRTGQEWSKNTSQEALPAVRDTGVFALCLDKNQSYLFSTSSWREKDIPFLLPELSQGKSTSISPKILHR